MTYLNTPLFKPMQSVIKPQAQQLTPRFSGTDEAQEDSFKIITPDESSDPFDDIGGMPIVELMKTEGARHEILGFALMAQVLKIPLNKVSLNYMKHRVKPEHSEVKADLSTLPSQAEMLNYVLFSVAGSAATLANIKLSADVDNIEIALVSKLEQAKIKINEIEEIGMFPDDIDKTKVLENAVKTVVKIISLIPEAKQTELIEKALKLKTIDTQELPDFYNQVLGEDFNWEALEDIAREFIMDPVSEYSFIPSVMLDEPIGGQGTSFGLSGIQKAIFKNIKESLD